MNINRLSSVILFTIVLLFFLIPPSSAQDILATKRGIVKLMKAVHEREMVVYGSIRWLYAYGSLEWVYNSTTTWTRYTTDGTIPATTKDPPLNWLDGENYPLNTQYITDLYNATRNLAGHYYKYDPAFAPLYFTDFTIEELPPTPEPAEALQSIADTLKKLEWIKLTSWQRGNLRHDGANWSWNPSGLYTGYIGGGFSGSPYGYQGSYNPAFISLLVPESLQSDLTIIFHFYYSEWCDPQGQCNPMWHSFSKSVSVSESALWPEIESGGGWAPQEPPEDIPVDIKMDVHKGLMLEESPDDVYGENIWSHGLTNASRESRIPGRWGGTAGRSSWYGYNGDDWTGSSTWYGWTSRWKNFYNRIDIGGVDSDTWLTLYQDPLILRQSYPADVQPTETSRGRWYSASTSGNLTFDRITAKIKFEYPGEISFVTEREEWCGDGCLFPRIEIGSSANLSNGNMYDSIEIGNITLSYNSLLNYTGPLGNNWTHNYNIHLSSISDTITLLDEDGTSIKFTDDDNDGIYESEARFGEHTRIVKETDGSYLFTRKDEDKYSFNSSGRLIRIEGRNGNTTSLIYTGDNLTIIRDPYGRETHFTYLDNRITLMTFPGERVVTFGYDTGGNLATITKPEGEIWQYSYDIEGRMVTKTSPNRTVTRYTHDEKGKLISSQVGNDPSTLITYDESNNRAVVRNPLGNTTTYIYDKPKNVWTEITDTQGNVIRKTWDESRNNLTSTDEAGSATTNTYDDIGNLLTTQDPEGNQTTYTYEPVYNQLTSETDALGSVTEYNYDEGGNRSSVTDPLGNTTHYAYDGRGQLVTTTDPKGNVTTNTYDEYGNVNSVTDAVGNTTHYTYDITGNLITSEDAIGNITQYEYDTADRLLMVSLRAEGEVISTTYTYDTLGNRLTQTDAQGNTTRFIYDYKNRLIEVTDPQDNKTTHTYDSTGNRLSTRDARGNTTTFTYDSLNRQISQTNPEGKTTHYEYDTRGNRTKAQDPDGNITNYTYDNLNRLTSTTNAQGNQTSYTYDAVGRVLSSTFVGEGGGEGSITAHTYDALGRQIQITDSLGNTTQYTYDEAGNRTSVTDQLGRATHYSYDSLNRIISITDPEGNATAYTYDGVGNKISETDSEGRTTRYAYDSLNRLIETTDPGGKNTTYTYDANGNRTSITDHLGNTWQLAYDSLNRLISETDTLGNTTTYTYDANGNKTGITNPLGRITHYTYNSLNQLTSITDPLNGTTSFTYDARGNRTSIRDANGHTRRFIYDSVNRLISEQDHLGNTTTYTYDAKGNLTSKTTPNGDTITYAYDSLNRLITKGTVPVEVITNTYDKAGNLTRQENSKTTIENAYDKKNRLISQILTQLWQDGSQTVRTIQYGYDTIGNRTSMIDPEGGITTYTYDPITKNLLSITDSQGKTTKYTYDNLNRRIKAEYPNKTRAEYTYDSLGRIILLTNYDSSGKIISSYSYTYDKAGNRTNMTTMDKTLNYTYDSLNRLTGANVQELLPNENWWINYTYDKVGNRTNMLIDSTKPVLPWNEYSPTLDQVPFINKPMQVTYTYNEIDQLIYEYGYEYGLKIGWGSPYEVWYDYDEDGNMVEKTLYKGWSMPGAPESAKVTIYTYDAEDRLVDIQFPNNQTNIFYDCFCGAKQMEYTDAKGEITRYFLDGDQVLFEYDGNNRIKARYTNGPGIDEKISLTRYNSKGEKTTYYYHYDGLGSVTALTDESGKLVETYDYDPYGVIIDHQKNVTKNLYTYTGRNYIPDAGIYYYRNRTYDPRPGRFGQIDPLLHQPSSVTQTIQSFIRATNCQTCGTTSQDPIQAIPISRVTQNLSTILEHPYVYVRNNPIRFTDPTGEVVVGFTGGFVGPGDPTTGIRKIHRALLDAGVSNQESIFVTYAQVDAAFNHIKRAIALRPNQPIILYGHSWGAGKGAIKTAKKVKNNLCRDTDLFVSIDAVVDEPVPVGETQLNIPGYIRYNINFYQPRGVPPLYFHGGPNYGGVVIINIDEKDLGFPDPYPDNPLLSGKLVDHTTIDQHPDIRAQVVRSILLIINSY